MLLAFNSCFYRPASQHLQKAEELSREGDLAGAIRQYRQHIQDRLAQEQRPDWENPYFYELLIGDLYLRSDNFDLALKSYEMAESQGIDKSLVADRYRLVAARYEQLEEYDSALTILTRYRDRDPLLFDLVSDRVARAIVQKEEAERTGQSSLLGSAASAP